MRWHIANVLKSCVFRIVDVHGNDFVVLSFFVPHGHDTDGPRSHDDPWRHFFTTEDQHIERITVWTICLRDEAVISDRFAPAVPRLVPLT